MKTPRIVVIAMLAAAACLWPGIAGMAAAGDSISIADNSFAAIA